VGLQREFAGEGATKKTASELVAAIGATVEGDGVRNSGNRNYDSPKYRGQNGKREEAIGPSRSRFSLFRK
jgi:hypothetical protein